MNPRSPLPALLLGLVLAIGALPSLAGAQEVRIHIDGLTRDPIPITSLSPMGSPPIARSAPVGPQSSTMAFTTPSGGLYSARLTRALMTATSFRRAVIELLENGQVQATITLSDVRVTSLQPAGPGPGAEDEIVLEFRGMVTSAGSQNIPTASP